VSERGEELVITDRGRPVARLVPEPQLGALPRAPLRIRPAKLDMSDLSWMKPRRTKAERRVSDHDIAEALNFTRSDKLFP
jgi:antitoxin (DNA-binding transcriptional repressor) of toxin-antitoxin stability system